MDGPCYNQLVEKKNILHVFNSSILGGPEKAILPALIELNQKVEFKCQTYFIIEERIDKKTQELCPQYSKNLGLETFRVNTRSKLDFKCIKKMRATLLEIGPTIIHCHDIKASLYIFIASLGLKIPIISTFHGFARIGITGKLYEYIYFFFMNFIDIIIALNPSIKKRIDSKLMKKTHLRVIPNGIKKTSSELPTNLIQEKFNLKKEKTNILLLGRLSPEKNHTNLIHALKELNDSSTHLHFIGNGCLEDELKSLTKRLGLSDQISFWGYIENADHYISGFDATILPSLTEGVSMSLVESALAKVPLIVSNIPENKFVLPEPDMCWELDPYDIGSITLVLKSFLNSTSEEKEKRSHNAYNQVNKFFTIDRWVKETSKLYQEALS